MDSEETRLLSEIDKKVAILESEQIRILSARKILWSIAVAVVAQIVLGAVAYGKLLQKVESMDYSVLEANVNTALSVAGQHGEEFGHVRDDIKMVRNRIVEIDKHIGTATADRFYRQDGIRHEKIMEGLDQRINRIETLIWDERIYPRQQR